MWLSLAALGLITIALIWGPNLWSPADPEPVKRPTAVPQVLRPRGDFERTAEYDVEAIRDAIRHGTVKLTGRAGNRAVLGAGFLIGEPLRIVTNYHVVAGASELEAVLHDGRRVSIAGCLVAAPTDDLAVLAFQASPSGCAALTLADRNALEPLDPIVAVGHPQGLDFSLFDGRVSRLTPSKLLPEESRSWVAQRMSLADDHVWIQHTARLAPGNSGGPLLNASGEVVGVNTWMNRETGFNYALGLSALTRVLDQSASAEPSPLPVGIAAAESLDAEQLEALLQAGEEIDFIPKTEPDGLQLRRLAEAISVLRENGDAAETLTEAIERLRSQTWGKSGQIVAVNEAAARRLEEAGSGQFLFVTVERLVHGQGGKSAALATLSGFERRLLLPLADEKLPEPVRGGHYLLLGRNERGEVVRFGENPLALEAAVVIAPAVWIRLPEEGTEEGKKNERPAG